MAPNRFWPCEVGTEPKGAACAQAEVKAEESDTLGYLELLVEQQRGISDYDLTYYEHSTPDSAACSLKNAYIDGTMPVSGINDAKVAVNTRDLCHEEGCYRDECAIVDLYLFTEVVSIRERGPACREKIVCTPRSHSNLPRDAIRLLSGEFRYCVVASCESGSR